MSRYKCAVTGKTAKTVFPSLVVADTAEVILAHGYDRPLHDYFCDVAPDFEVGIHYGGVSWTKELSRTEYLLAIHSLTLEQAAKAVATDMPY